MKVKVNFQSRKSIDKAQRKIESLQDQIDSLQKDIETLKHTTVLKFKLSDGGTGRVTASGDLIISRYGYYTILGYFMKRHHMMSLTPFYEFVYTENGIPELISDDPEPKDLKQFAIKLSNFFAKATGYNTPNGQNPNGLRRDFDKDYERLQEVNKDIEQAGFSILM